MNDSKIHHEPATLHASAIDAAAESRNSIRLELADIWMEQAVEVVDSLFMFWRQIQGAELDVGKIDDLYKIYKGVRSWQKNL